MDAIVAALITGAGGILALWFQNRWSRKSFRDEWQKRAGELDERLQMEHDRRVADLKAEAQRERRRADRAEDELRRGKSEGHDQQGFPRLEHERGGDRATAGGAAEAGT